MAVNQALQSRELGKLAISERGKKIRHTEREVELALKMVIHNGGDLKNTSLQLKEEGVTISRNTLYKWRERDFPRLFAQLRHELTPDVTEEIAGRALERAMQANEAEDKYLKEAVKKVGEVDPNHLAKNAMALANAKQTNIQAAQLLRDRPTAIVEDRSLSDLVGALERLGVAKKVEDVVDAEVVE